MRAPIALGILVTLAQPLAAQAADPTASRFTNLQQGYCINFLISPEDAPGVLPDDAQPVHLNAMADAPPALARVLVDQPEYGNWMPAAVCFYRFGRADMAGRELVAAAGASEMIGIVAYGARVAVNQPDNGISVGLLFTNDKRVAKLTDSTQVPFRLIKVTFGKAPHGDDERHVIAFGKTKLTWDGHAASDSSVLTAPIDRVWVASGRRGKPILMRWSLKATTSRSMVGALLVQGKDKLAKLLRKSPIRYLGPMYQGGVAELTPVPE